VSTLGLCASRAMTNPRMRCWKERMSMITFRRDLAHVLCCVLAVLASGISGCGDQKQSVAASLPLSVVEPWRVEYTSSGDRQGSYSETIIWSKAKPGLSGTLASTTPVALDVEAADSYLQRIEWGGTGTVKSIAAIRDSKHSVILVETTTGWYAVVSESSP
jgi:hypothetical protein